MFKNVIICCSLGIYYIHILGAEDKQLGQWTMASWRELVSATRYYSPHIIKEPGRKNYLER